MSRYRHWRHRLALARILWARFTWRHWCQSWRQMILLVLILATGVGVFTAVRLASRAAISGFEVFTRTLTGQADFVLTASGHIPEGLLRELRTRCGKLPVWIGPVLEASGGLPGEHPQDARAELRLLGVDVIGLQNYPTDQASVAESMAGLSLFGLLGSTEEVLVAPQLAAQRGWQAGDRFDLIVDGRVHTLAMAGEIPVFSGQPPPPDNLLVFDLPGLQYLTGRSGQLDRIELRLPDGPRAIEQRAALAEILADFAGDRDLNLFGDGEGAAAGETLTRAFRMNLSVLSLLALWVGMVLILQALDGAVVRRRSEIGILISLGFRAPHIRAAWLWEAFFLGVAGSLLGLVIGWWGAQMSVETVARSVSTLYFATTVDSVTPSLLELAIGFAAGVSASLLAAWIPARQAAATPPAQLMGKSLHTGAVPGWRRAITGCALWVLALIFYTLPPIGFDDGTRFPLFAFGAAFLAIAGTSLLAVFTFAPLKTALHGLASRFAVVRLALSFLQPPSLRHQLALGGLVLAVGMAGAMALLIASFERSVEAWVESGLRADIFISTGGPRTASSLQRLPGSLWRELAQDPRVVATDAYQPYAITIDGIDTEIQGGDLKVRLQRTAPVWVSRPDNAFVQDPGAAPARALISESFQRIFAKGRGDTLRLPTPSGTRSVTIAGVYADYSNERGILLLDRSWIEDWYGEDRIFSAAYYLADPQLTEAVIAEWKAAHPGLRVYNNAQLRATVLRLFHQTFGITYALLGIAVVVAVAGIGLALASAIYERRREWTILRALGMTAGELGRVAAVEGGLTAVVGVTGGILLSLVLGAVLIFGVNVQSFGWTLAFHVPWTQLVGLAGLVICASALVAWAVGMYTADLPVDREE